MPISFFAAADASALHYAAIIFGWYCRCLLDFSSSVSSYFVIFTIAGCWFRLPLRFFYYCSLLAFLRLLILLLKFRCCQFSSVDTSLMAFDIFQLRYYIIGFFILVSQLSLSVFSFIAGQAFFSVSSY